MRHITGTIHLYMHGIWAGMHSTIDKTLYSRIVRHQSQCLESNPFKPVEPDHPVEPGACEAQHEYCNRMLGFVPQRQPTHFALLKVLR